MTKNDYTTATDLVRKLEGECLRSALIAEGRASTLRTLSWIILGVGILASGAIVAVFLKDNNDGSSPQAKLLVLVPIIFFGCALWTAVLGGLSSLVHLSAKRMRLELSRYDDE